MQKSANQTDHGVPPNESTVPDADCQAHRAKRPWQQPVLQETALPDLTAGPASSSFDAIDYSN